MPPSPPFASQVVFESQSRHAVSVVPHQCVLVIHVLKSYEQQPLPLVLPVGEGTGAFATGAFTGVAAVGAFTGAFTGAFATGAATGGGGDEPPDPSTTETRKKSK